MMHTYYDNEEKYVFFEKLFGEFVDNVESEGLQE